MALLSVTAPYVIASGRRLSMLRPSWACFAGFCTSAVADWQTVVGKTAGLPEVLRAALLLDAWHNIEVLCGGWIGSLLVAGMLCQVGST